MKITSLRSGNLCMTPAILPDAGFQTLQLFQSKEFS